MDSDWILIYKMKQGNDGAWEQFIRKYYADILKYCFFHCQNRQSAEDLTQEVFLRFISALDRYQHRGKAKNYLYTIAGNLCKDQRILNPAVSLEELADMDSDFSVKLDERMMLEAAIRCLPEEFREVILLHYYQGLKLSDIADVLKIGLPLVKYRLKRAKELLRKELEHESE